MELPGNDFFSTAAQVIITAILVFAVESRVVRQPNSVSPTGTTTAAGLLVVALAGLAGCFVALATGPSRGNVVLASAALIASGGLVLVPAFIAMTGSAPTRTKSQRVKQLLVSLVVLVGAVLALLAVVDLVLVPEFNGR